MSAIIPGLNAADSNTYTQALHDHCDVRMQVRMLTLSHQLVSSIAPVQLDGQINVTQADSAGITKTLQMGFYDPDHALRLDSNAPTNGVGGSDRLIQIKTFVRTPQIGWLGAPAITARPSVIGRDGDVVTVEAQGKEVLHLRDVWADEIGAGGYVVNAIKTILQRGGETRFRFPTTAAVRNKVPKKVYFGGGEPDKRPWVVAWNLAHSIGLQLYYDTSGYACLRRAPAWDTSPEWELFETGPNANTLSRLKYTTDLTTIKNRVVVRGMTVPPKARKGQKAQKAKLLTSVPAVAPASHPFSAQSLAQNGHLWYNTAFITRDDLHTQAAVNAFARTQLNNLLIGNTDLQTTTLPVWHLEPLDIIKVHAAAATFSLRLKDASIPLGPSADGMSIGYRMSVRSISAGRLRGR